VSAQRALIVAVATPDWRAFLETNQWEGDYLGSVSARRRGKTQARAIDLGLAK
jgi:hypothetical protein